MKKLALALVFLVCAISHSSFADENDRIIDTCMKGGYCDLSEISKALHLKVVEKYLRGIEHNTGIETNYDELLASQKSYFSMGGREIHLQKSKKQQTKLAQLNLCLNSKDKSTSPTQIQAKRIHILAIENYKEAIQKTEGIDEAVELLQKSRKVYFGVVEKDYTGATWGLTNN